VRLFQSLRARLLGIVLLGAVLPLAIVGVWLARATRQSGERLLRERLDSTLVRTAREIGAQWVPRRSAMLAIAEDSVIRQLLRRDSNWNADTVPLNSSRSTVVELIASARSVTVEPREHGPPWKLVLDRDRRPSLVRTSPPADSFPAGELQLLRVELPVFASSLATDTLGIVTLRFAAERLIPPAAGSVAGAGALLSVVDRSTGATVVPLPFDPALLRRHRFNWAGEEWLTAALPLEEPYVELLAAAPLGGFTLPFKRATRDGLLALALVALVVTALTVLLLRGLTRPLVQLAATADAVSAGELDRRVEPGPHDEVGRVARAFNAMTLSLRRTLDALSAQSAVAAVGEFATALAHEVRNPLSAIRLNLQHLQEKASAHADLGVPIANALRDIERLELTVASALRISRSGRGPREVIELWPVLTAAARAAQPEFSARGATLAGFETTIHAPLRVRGDAAALEQLFLNLLLNAAQALPTGGAAGLSLEQQPDGLVVTIWDRGKGMSEEMRRKVFEPFYSTKPEGTGLGLTLAQRIVAAHRGQLELESKEGEGTRVRVTLPPAELRCPESANAS
jgi:signal transduction histidine kinase